MKKIIQFIFITCLSLPIFSFAQKAYEAVYYNGKTQNITIKFTLANGYIGACEIKTTDNTTKKTSKFLPSTGSPNVDKKIKFDHTSNTGKKFTDYFIIDGMEDNYETVPKKILGTYYFNGASYNFTLLKM